MSSEYGDSAEKKSFLMDQYEKAWEKARSEEINTGVVTEATEQLLLAIEIEMEMFQNAV